MVAYAESERLGESVHRFWDAGVGICLKVSPLFFVSGGGICVQNTFGTHPGQPLPTGCKGIPFIVGERGIAWGVRYRGVL